jgi:hypothetical protein
MWHTCICLVRVYYTEHRPAGESACVAVDLFFRVSGAHLTISNTATRPSRVATSYASELLNSANMRLQAFSAWSWLYTWESGGHQPCMVPAYTSTSAGK